MNNHLEGKEKRSLSSSFTFIYKYVFPVFWVVCWSLGTAALFLSPTEGSRFPMKWFFLLAGISGVFFIYRFCIRLKAVSVDEKFLYVSVYRKEIAIPLSEVEDVTENAWINPRMMTIKLRSPSPFGDRILFMPDGNSLSTPEIKERMKLPSSPFPSAGVIAEAQTSKNVVTEYENRKRLRLTLTVGWLLYGILILWTPLLRRDLLPYFLFGGCFIFGALFHFTWRCPRCRYKFGRAWSLNKCPSCGVSFQKT
ncbi:MAG: hypothetical protein U1F57_07420 [bacterium]